MGYLAEDAGLAFSSSDSPPRCRRSPDGAKEREEEDATVGEAIAESSSSAAAAAAAAAAVIELPFTSRSAASNCCFRLSSSASILRFKTGWHCKTTQVVSFFFQADSPPSP